MSVDTSNATAAAGVDPARARVAGAIKQAANTTGASFEYLLATAKMESDFNPTAGASTSSAHGLYQFIEQTWLGTVKEAGGQLGYGQYADAITKTSSGDYVVDDPGMRRVDHEAARRSRRRARRWRRVLTQSNSFQLTGKIGRRPTDGELYMAHFMGVGGAAKLIAQARGQSAGLGRADVSERGRRQPLDLLRSQRQRAQRLRSLFGAERALCRRGQCAGHAQRRWRCMAMRPPPRPRRGRDRQRSASATAVAAVPAIDTDAFLSAFPDARSAAPPVTVASATRRASLRRRPIRSSARCFRPTRTRSRSRRRCANCGANRRR